MIWFPQLAFVLDIFRGSLSLAGKWGEEKLWERGN